MPVSVGIDLGTTYSAVAWVDPATGKPAVLMNGEGKPITPSVVQFVDGSPVFGSEAQSAFVAGEPGCAATFKRAMGDREPFCAIDGHEYTAEDLSALLLGHLKSQAEAALGDTIRDAVVTVPAYFFDREREATQRAAERAGLRVKKLIDEPNAAAMAYGLGNWRENANILVYDLGGGTFDVTLVHMGADGVLSTITTRGDHALGGRDWDGRLEGLLREKFADETGLELRSDAGVTAMLRGLVESVKVRLSRMEATTVQASFPGYGPAEVGVSRKEFEEATSDLLERTGSLCRAVLDDADLPASQVTDILLVGGSTRMPQVSGFLERVLGKTPIRHVNPDEAVALGAAIQATKGADSYADLGMRELPGGRRVTARDPGLMAALPVRPSRSLGDVGNIKLQETTAHAMGIIAINDETHRYYNEVIIPANHPRPVRSAKRFRFFTSADSANEAEIYVLQGEAENPLDCVIPYRYVVTGIQHVSRGERLGTVIRVQYSYDTNGIIRVQARQEDGTVDLPIRKDEVPRDVSKFGLSVDAGQAGQNSSTSLQVSRGARQDVVHKYRAITFSNVRWEQYDHITRHASGAEYNESPIHIVANEEAIEFHGYNISAMDEGVFYTISASDDFEIECDINTSTIKPHPGGKVKITLGIITASLDQNGGVMLLDGESVAAVGARFNLRMSLTAGGHYEVSIDGRLVGAKDKPAKRGVDVVFGLSHDSHHCQLLSHAYISDIKMLQGSSQAAEDEDPVVATWDD